MNLQCSENYDRKGNGLQRETRQESFIDIANAIRSQEQNSLMILQQPQEDTDESVSVDIVFCASFEKDVCLERPKNDRLALSAKEKKKIDQLKLTSSIKRVAPQAEAISRMSLSRFSRTSAVTPEIEERDQIRARRGKGSSETNREIQLRQCREGLGEIQRRLQR